MTICPLPFLPPAPYPPSPSQENSSDMSENFVRMLGSPPAPPVLQPRATLHRDTAVHILTDVILPVNHQSCHHQGSRARSLWSSCGST